MWFIIAIAILIVLIWVLKKFHSNATILTTYIWVAEGNSYGVEYKSNKPDIDSNEWVWLCILLPAKMLFKTSNIHEITKQKESIDKSRVVHQEILNTLQILGNSEWSCEKDIKQLVNNNLNVFEKKLSGECLRIPLHFMSKDSRSILLPFSTSSVFRFNEIWLAVIITSVRHMQELDLIILKNCLKEMKNLYLDNDPSSLEASYDIPRRALIKSLNTF